MSHGFLLVHQSQLEKSRFWASFVVRLFLVLLLLGWGQRCVSLELIVMSSAPAYVRLGLGVCLCFTEFWNVVLLGERPWLYHLELENLRYWLACACFFGLCLCTMILTEITLGERFDDPLNLFICAKIWSRLFWVIATVFKDGKTLAPTSEWLRSPSWLLF